MAAAAAAPVAAALRVAAPGVATRGVEAAVPADDDDEADERLALAAKGQKTVIYCIILNFVVSAIDRSHALAAFVVWALVVVICIYSLVGVLRICSGLDRSQNQKLLFMVLSFLPVINIVALVYLSVQTTRVLRAAGWRVGLLGARP
jgi:hypothetical protein